MLKGYTIGAQIGESLRQGEQQGANQATAADHFAAQLAEREAEAQRTYALHEQIQKEKSAIAARTLAGMQEYNALVASGVPKDKALMQAAPNLFYNQPEKLTTALHQLGLEQQAQRTASALDLSRQAQQRHNADTLAEMRRYHDYQMNKPGTSKLFHVGNSLVRVNPDGTQETLFTSNDPSKLDAWEHSELVAGVNRAFQATKDMDDPLVKDAQDKLEKFNKRVRSGGKTAVPKPLLRAQAMEFLQQANGDKEKARALARDAGYTLE